MDGPPPLSSDSESEFDPLEDPTKDGIEIGELTKDPKPENREPSPVVQSIPLKVSPAMSATSSAPEREPRIVSYKVYAELVKEYDVMHGQNMEL